MSIKTSCCITFSALVLSLFASTALAQESSRWIFPAATLQSHFDARDAGVAVVAVGDSIEQARSAADALQSALMESGIARKVTREGELLIHPATSDEIIIGRCEHSRFRMIFVVRVYPDAGGGDDMLVLTVLQRSSGYKQAYVLSVQAGRPLPMAKGREKAHEEASKGVSRKAISAIGEVREADKPAQRGRRVADVEDGRGAAGRPASEEIGFEKLVIVNGYGVQTNKIITPHVGPYKKKIDWKTFYQMVGRADLAEQYEQTFVIRNVLIWGGMSVACVAPMIILLPLVNTSADTVSTMLTFGVVSGVITTGGLVAWMIGFLMDEQPAKEHEIFELADLHNRGKAE